MSGSNQKHTASIDLTESDKLKKHESHNINIPGSLCCVWVGELPRLGATSARGVLIVGSGGWTEGSDVDEVEESFAAGVGGAVARAGDGTGTGIGITGAEAGGGPVGLGGGEGGSGAEAEADWGSTISRSAGTSATGNHSLIVGFHTVSSVKPPELWRLESKA